MPCVTGLNRVLIGELMLCRHGGGVEHWRTGCREGHTRGAPGGVSVCVGGGVGEADGVPRLWGPWF